MLADMPDARFSEVSDVYLHELVDLARDLNEAGD